MNPFRSGRRDGAFTLVEMLCVLAVIGILAALLLPALSLAKARAKRIQCVNNLEQVGIAFHEFLHDHGGKLPMQVSTNDGGSLEFVQSGLLVQGEFYFGYRHFVPLAGNLVTPKLLVCPADSRLPAANFATFRNDNLSYFVGVHADYSKPNSILAGDRNITNDWSGDVTLIRASFTSHVRWTDELHRFKGNLLFADAHVEESKDLRLSLPGDQTAESDLVLPSIQTPMIASLRSSPGPNLSSTGPIKSAPASQPGEETFAQGKEHPASGETAPPELAVTSSRITPSINSQEEELVRSETTPATGVVPPARTKTSLDDGMSSGNRQFVQTAHQFIKIAGWLWLLLLLILGGLGGYRAFRRLLRKRARSARLRTQPRANDKYVWSEAD